MRNTDEIRIYQITDENDKVVTLAAKDWTEAQEIYYACGNLPVVSYRSKLYKA